MENPIKEGVWFCLNLAPGRAWWLNVTTVKPKIPIRGRAGGQPQTWVIDAVGNCWYAPSGVNLHQVSDLTYFCTPADVPEVSRLLGLTLTQPEWAEAALAAGWSPPKF